MIVPFKRKSFLSTQIRIVGNRSWILVVFVFVFDVVFLFLFLFGTQMCMIGNPSRGLVVSQASQTPSSYVGGDGHNKSDIERSNQRENSWNILTWCICIFHPNALQCHIYDFTAANTTLYKTHVIYVALDT